MYPSLYEVLKSSNEKNKYRLFNQYLSCVTAEQRIPYTVMLELLPLCNFNCPMCYAKLTQEQVENSGFKVMDFEEWKYFIDGFIELGTKSFTLTGGECMLHPDFIKIYNYIYDKGNRIGLITNASCLTDDILHAFIIRPPSRINITVYGASEETYRRFCENGAAFEKVLKNIDRLLENNLPVELQTTVGKDNNKDYLKMLELANERGLSLAVSGVISKYGQCDDEKLEKTQIDCFDFNNDFKKQIDENNDIKYNPEDFYKKYVFPNTDKPIEYKGIRCAAAKNICSVSWRGTLKICSTFEPFILDPRKNGGIPNCWKYIVDWGNNVPRIIECQTCIFSKECITCTARHYNDTHEFGKPSPRLCFKIQHPEEAAKLQAEYDRRQALKEAGETE